MRPLYAFLFSTTSKALAWDFATLVLAPDDALAGRLSTPKARWALNHGLSPEKQERTKKREQTEGGHYRQLSSHCHIRNASCQHREKHRTPSLD